MTKIVYGAFPGVEYSACPATSRSIISKVRSSLGRELSSARFEKRPEPRCPQPAQIGEDRGCCECLRTQRSRSQPRRWSGTSARARRPRSGFVRCRRSPDGTSRRSCCSPRPRRSGSSIRRSSRSICRGCGKNLKCGASRRASPSSAASLSRSSSSCTCSCSIPSATRRARSTPAAVGRRPTTRGCSRSGRW